MTAAARHPVLRLCLLTGVLALSYFKWMPFPWRQPTVALIAIASVLAMREALSNVGFRWPVPVQTTMGWALVATAITAGLITPFVEPFLNRITGTAADYSGYGALKGNLPDAMQLIAYAWVSAAIGEEIIFRGFLLHQTRAAFGPGVLATAGGVALGTALFGLSHHTQGLVGVLLTGLTGFLMSVVFLLSRRNVWSIILAHGLIDTWGVLTLYFGWY